MYVGEMGTKGLLELFLDMDFKTHGPLSKKDSQSRQNMMLVQKLY